MEDAKAKRIRRPSPAQMRAAAEVLRSTQAADALHREALDSAAAWIDHEADKAVAS